MTVHAIVRVDSLFYTCSYIFCFLKIFSRTYTPLACALASHPRQAVFSVNAASSSVFGRYFTSSTVGW